MTPFPVRTFLRSFLLTASCVALLAFGVAFSRHEDFMPHGHCIRWTPWLLWGRAFSDGAIALTYVVVATMMFQLVRALPALFFSPNLIRLYASFILLCGVTHVSDVVTIWLPTYDLDLCIRIATAIGSIATLIALMFARKDIEQFIAGRQHDAR